MRPRVALIVAYALLALPLSSQQPVTIRPGGTCRTDLRSWQPPVIRVPAGISPRPAPTTDVHARLTVYPNGRADGSTAELYPTVPPTWRAVADSAIAGWRTNIGWIVTDQRPQVICTVIRFTDGTDPAADSIPPSSTPETVWQAQPDGWVIHWRPTRPIDNYTELPTSPWVRTASGLYPDLYRATDVLAWAERTQWVVDSARGLPFAQRQELPVRSPGITRRYRPPASTPWLQVLGADHNTRLVASVYSPSANAARPTGDVGLELLTLTCDGSLRHDSTRDTLDLAMLAAARHAALTALAHAPRPTVDTIRIYSTREVSCPVTRVSGGHEAPPEDDEAIQQELNLSEAAYVVFTVDRSGVVEPASIHVMGEWGAEDRGRIAAQIRRLRFSPAVRGDQYVRQMAHYIVPPATGACTTDECLRATTRPATPGELLLTWEAQQRTRPFPPSTPWNGVSHAEYALLDLWAQAAPSDTALLTRLVYVSLHLGSPGARALAHTVADTVLHPTIRLYAVWGLVPFLSEWRCLIVFAYDSRDVLCGETIGNDMQLHWVADVAHQSIDPVLRDSLRAMILPVRNEPGGLGVVVSTGFTQWSATDRWLEAVRQECRTAATAFRSALQGEALLPPATQGEAGLWGHSLRRCPEAGPPVMASAWSRVRPDSLSLEHLSLWSVANQDQRVLDTLQHLARRSTTPHAIRVAAVRSLDAIVHTNLRRLLPPDIAEVVGREQMFPPRASDPTGGGTCRPTNGLTWVTIESGDQPLTRESLRGVVRTLAGLADQESLGRMSVMATATTRCIERLSQYLLWTETPTDR